MKVRSARIEDARAIAEVHVRTWQVAYPGIVPDDYLASLSIDKYEAMWRSNIAKGSPYLLVATERDNLVGWVAYGSSRDGGAAADVAEIWAIYVAAGHWGKGVGHQLWQHARPHLRELGFQVVTLWAFPENTRAAGFYRSIGFQVEASSRKQFPLGAATLNEVRFARRVDA